MIAEQCGVKDLEGLGLAGHTQAVCAAGALLHYLRETSAKSDGQTAALVHLDTLRFYEQQDALVLDPVTVRNLELVSPLFADEAPRGSHGAGPATLLAAIDATVTSMGARLLRSWVLRPEIDRDEIEARLDAVAELKSHTMLREEIRDNLRGVQDLERLASRATLGVATPRDLVALRQSLARIPLVRRFLGNCLLLRLVALLEEIDELADVHERLEKTIAEDPPPLCLRTRRHRPRRQTPNSTNCATSASTAARSSPPWKSASASAPASPRSRSASTRSSASIWKSRRPIFLWSLPISNASKPWSTPNASPRRS